MARAAILMYHIVDAPRSEREAKYCCLPTRFAEQMAWIAEECHALGLDELLVGLEGKAKLPENTVAITFDDGFADTFERAMPVLSKHRIAATMYVVANRIGASSCARRPLTAFHRLTAVCCPS